MPAETARNLGVLQQKGVPVYFLESFPDKTPGYHDRQQHSAQLKEYIQSGAFKDPIPDNKDTLSDVLADSRIYPESIKQEGMSFIRKSHKDGYLYFISNLSDYNIDGHYSFARKFRAAEILNPLTGMRGKAGTREDHAGTVVRLQLEPGQSVFLITYDHNIKQADWHYIGKQYKPVDLNRPWKISFENKLDEYELDSLRSWTELPFSWAPYYSGKAIYTITFDFDTTRIHTDALMLDLGDLRYMATAWLNHEKIGDFWCVPFQVMISPDLLKPVNTLVLEVQNLDANRIIQIDRERIPWKDFYDINFVDIGYQPFDASSWTPLPSGLLGPVRLIPVSF
jgi:hypothetical protein